MNKMNIFLMGYRGCGKTTLGKKLAQRLWKTFVDVDGEVCKRFGDKTIAAIWAEHGEPEWRRVETEVTEGLCGKKNQVIALGGGTLMQPAAREAVRGAKGAVRIYLKCTPEELYRRVVEDAKSAESRPALTGSGGDLDEVKRVLSERGPVYEELADKVFDVTHVDVENGLRYLIDRCL
jgi:shikimate kinase